MENIIFFHINEIVPHKGGVSKATYNLSQNLSRHGHKVWFVAAKKTFYEDEFENQLYLPEASALVCPRNVEFLTNLIAEKQISIIINQCPIYSACIDLFSKLKDNTSLRIISCFHNSILTPLYNYAYQKEYMLTKNHLRYIFKSLDTKLAKNIIVGLYKIKHKKEYNRIIDESNAVVLLNDGLVEELIDLTNTREIYKLHSIANACSIQEDFIPSSKSKSIVWVGTFDIATKRPDLMIKVWSNLFEKYPEWTLKMLGDGRGLEEMKELSKKMKIKNISFEGRVDPTPYYKEASIIAVTSTHESFSLVTIEALHYKCVPVVFNSFPAASIIISNNVNGVLVEPFSLTKFENSLSSLMQDSISLERMSAQSELTMPNFDDELIYHKWYTLFKAIK